MALQVGGIIRLERTFTAEDVRLFTTVSKDEGVHHITPNEHGNFVVQGLLTATLPTKVGRDYNVLARTINFEFLRPVFTNDTIQCSVTVEQYEPAEKNRIAISTTFSCINQHSKEVLKGNFAGVILGES